MSTELNLLEQKLELLYKKGELSNSRVVFDLGVEFGKEIERQKLAAYSFAFWNQLEQDNKADKEIRIAASKINDFVLKLLRFSIKEYIGENGSWSIAKSSSFSDSNKFEQHTVDRLNIQLDSVVMEQYGGEFKCEFAVTGELLEIFKSNNIYEKLEVHIYNDHGEEEMTIHDVNDVDAAVQRLHCHVRNSNDWPLEKYEDFLVEISKPFIFTIIANS
jgi:predicted small metal-binding protein